jgi:hypothetical protein
VGSSVCFSMLTELMMAGLGFWPWMAGAEAKKSTVAALLHRSAPASAIVHTDDIAWYHSFFDWSDLLVEGILKPLRNGRAVSYRPPGWEKRGRTPYHVTINNIDTGNGTATVSIGPGSG